MQTIVTKELIHSLLIALKESDLLRYIALDQGQADEDLEGTKYRGMIYPAALVDIQNERVEERAKDSTSQRADIEIRLFFDTPLFANIAAPRAHIDSATEHYQVVDKIIKEMRACHLFYKGFTRGTREKSITEIVLHFEARAFIYSRL